MQFLKAGERSKHRHMWRRCCSASKAPATTWDLKFDCLDAFDWQWADAPKKFEWQRGDFIYVPPFTKEMGFDWFDQIENAPGF
jgi:hypothetical protein